MKYQPARTRARATVSDMALSDDSRRVTDRSLAHLYTSLRSLSGPS